MTIKKQALGVVGMGLVFAVAGCATGVDTSSRPPVANLQQGLNLFKTDGLISGAYLKGARAIYFETARGPEAIDVYQRAGMAKYEIDVRVLDENGRTVYFQTGGDTLVNPTWGADLAADAKLPTVDPVERAGSFELLKEASGAIQQASVSTALIHEHSALANMASSVRENMLVNAVTKSIAETGYSPGNNVFELHKMCLFGCLGGAEHSATWTNINGTVRNSCNHGNCASSMSFVCSGSGSAGVDYHEYSTQNGSVNSPACTSGYNWSSNGNHNCHDDSVREMWGMYYGDEGSGTSGVCNNTASHWSAPTSCPPSSW